MGLLQKLSSVTTNTSRMFKATNAKEILGSMEKMLAVAEGSFFFIERTMGGDLLTILQPGELKRTAVPGTNQNEALALLAPSMGATNGTADQQVNLSSYMKALMEKRDNPSSGVKQRIPHLADSIRAFAVHWNTFQSALKNMLEKEKDLAAAHDPARLAIMSSRLEAMGNNVAAANSRAEFWVAFSNALCHLNIAPTGDGALPLESLVVAFALLPTECSPLPYDDKGKEKEIYADLQVVFAKFEKATQEHGNMRIRGLL
jgi:hypothetical protein